jgi:hypothetical protein
MRAVAHQRIGADGAPVVEVLENLQALLDDFVTLVTLDMGDEADAAGVMLILRVIQTLGGGNRVNRVLVVVHGDTVCEEAGQAVKPLFFCRSALGDHDGALLAARLRGTKSVGNRNIRDESRK